MNDPVFPSSPAVALQRELLREKTRQTMIDSHNALQSLGCTKIQFSVTTAKEEKKDDVNIKAGRQKTITLAIQRISEVT